MDKHLRIGNTIATIQRVAQPTPGKDRVRRNHAGGIPVDLVKIRAVLDRIARAENPDAQKQKSERFVRDPRRITAMAYNVETQRFDVSALPGSMKLRDKWSVTAENDRNRLHVAYVGTLFAGDHEFTIVRVDAELVRRGIFSLNALRQDEEEPPVNTFVNAVRNWMRPCMDILPNVPSAGDARRYQCFIGRAGGWYIQAGLIGGKGIQQIRVVEGGIIATNGSNSLWFLSAQRILSAAMANEPLPADKGSWAELYRGSGGSIGFITPVYEQAGALHVTINDQSGERRAVSLGALKAS